MSYSSAPSPFPFIADAIDEAGVHSENGTTGVTFLTNGNFRWRRIYLNKEGSVTRLAIIVRSAFSSSQLFSSRLQTNPGFQGVSESTYFGGEPTLRYTTGLTLGQNNQEFAVNLANGDGKFFPEIAYITSDGILHIRSTHLNTEETNWINFYTTLTGRDDFIS